jgi:DNA-binding CsgD family transcriptional regulator
MEHAVELERGRESYAAQAWADAYEQLSRVDRDTSLDAGDLELLANSAYMAGRDEEYLRGLERAHNAYTEAGDLPAAVRCAFWHGLALMLAGEGPRADGWFGRAERLLARCGSDCVERGYLLIPVLLEHKGRGDYEEARAAAAEAAAIGERFEDRDLSALTVQEEGHALVLLGKTKEGLRLIDEVMVSVIAGEISPPVTGLIYCNTIAFCQSVYQVRRARDWTAALSRWCEEQPDLVAVTGQCLVHRAEIMQLEGAWLNALSETQRARERFSRASVASGSSHREGNARYREAELHRLRGELAAAEQAYRKASLCGVDPQPGLALLRLAEGDHEAAMAGICRALAEVSEPLDRAGLLPARIEIALADGDLDAARDACGELERIAGGAEVALLDAIAQHARGAVELEAGAPEAAATSLRQAQRFWEELGAPYETARTRELVASACHALGDEESAALELEAARETFAALGATLDLTRVDSHGQPAPGRGAHGLTARELEVLRLVAAGNSNRKVAETLVVSEHTVARHLQNIYAKLGVSSRTAASAFAFSKKLV